MIPQKRPIQLAPHQATLLTILFSFNKVVIALKLRRLTVQCTSGPATNFHLVLTLILREIRATMDCVQWLIVLIDPDVKVISTRLAIAA